MTDFSKLCAVEILGPGHFSVRLRDEAWRTFTPSQRYHGAVLRLPITLQRSACQWWIETLRHVLAQPNRPVPKDGGWPKKGRRWLRENGTYLSKPFLIRRQGSLWELLHDGVVVSTHPRLVVAKRAADRLAERLVDQSNTTQ